MSKLALFASVVVLNPAAKWGVYVASFWLGTALLAPVPGAALTDVSPSAGPDILLRLIVGNVIIAAGCAVVGYAVVLRLVREYRRRELSVSDLLADEAPE